MVHDHQRWTITEKALKAFGVGIVLLPFHPFMRSEKLSYFALVSNFGSPFMCFEGSGLGMSALLSLHRA